MQLERLGIETRSVDSAKAAHKELSEAFDQQERFDLAVLDLERGDLAAVGRAAHSLKGSSLNMCASPTSEAAARLESAARAGAAEDIAKLEMQLRAETRRAMEYLRARQG